MKLLLLVCKVSLRLSCNMQAALPQT
jgi:hypothetical protein